MSKEGRAVGGRKKGGREPKYIPSYQIDGEVG